MARTILIASLVLICFLYALNLYLRGRYRRAIEAYLGIAIFTIVLASLIFASWKFAILMFCMAFILIALFTKPAKLLARKLLGYRTGIHEFEGDYIESFTTGRTSFTDMMKSISERREKKEKRLKAIANRPSISAVLKSEGLSVEEYLELFDYLERANLHDIAYEIVQNPEELLSLIDLRHNGTDLIEVNSFFRFT